MRTRWAYFVLLTAALLAPAGAGGAPAKPDGKPTEVSGAYSVTVAGAYRGTGKAAVGAQSVTLNIKVEDDAGRQGRLKASNLSLVNGRFHGKGTLMGMEVIFDGRVDPPDRQGEVVRKARIVCTFVAADGHAGRAAGSKDGGGGGDDDDDD